VRGLSYLWHISQPDLASFFTLPVAVAIAGVVSATVGLFTVQASQGWERGAQPEQAEAAHVVGDAGADLADQELECISGSGTCRGGTKISEVAKCNRAASGMFGVAQDGRIATKCCRRRPIKERDPIRFVRKRARGVPPLAFFGGVGCGKNHVFGAERTDSATTGLSNPLHGHTASINNSPAHEALLNNGCV
jgi:hypothetical protein